jgi:hypothetical protein
MSDYSFMRSGLVGPATSPSDDDKLEFMRKVMSLLRVLMEESTKTGIRFAHSCGRRDIGGMDQVLALKYEAHRFFDRDFEPRFLEVLNEERQHTYTTDDESSDDEMPGDTEEPYTATLVASADDTERAFHMEVLGYHRSWANWQPTDHMQLFIKDAVDKAEEALTEYKDAIAAGDRDPLIRPALSVRDDRSP